MKVRVYWGSAADFMRELRRPLAGVQARWLSAAALTRPVRRPAAVRAARSARASSAAATEARALASLIVAHRVVLLYAASGAGKTSLLNAGVIPLARRRRRSRCSRRARLRGLADAPRSRQPVRREPVGNLRARSATTARTAETLPGFLAARPAPEASDALAAPRALVIDQFEELFTLYPGRWPQRGRGLRPARARRSTQDPLLRVVLAIREDFIAQLDPYAMRLPTRCATRMRLEPLRRPAALVAVRAAAQRRGRDRSRRGSPSAWSTTC